MIGNNRNSRYSLSNRSGNAASETEDGWDLEGLMAEVDAEAKAKKPQHHQQSYHQQSTRLRSNNRSLNVPSSKNPIKSHHHQRRNSVSHHISSSSSSYNNNNNQTNNNRTRSLSMLPTNVNRSNRSNRSPSTSSTTSTLSNLSQSHRSPPELNNNKRRKIAPKHTSNRNLTTNNIDTNSNSTNNNHIKHEPVDLSTIEWCLTKTNQIDNKSVIHLDEIGLIKNINNSNYFITNEKRTELIARIEHLHKYREFPELRLFAGLVSSDHSERVKKVLKHLGTVQKKKGEELKKLFGSKSRNSGKMSLTDCVKQKKMLQELVNDYQSIVRETKSRKPGTNINVNTNDNIKQETQTRIKKEHKLAVTKPNNVNNRNQRHQPQPPVLSASSLMPPSCNHSIKRELGTEHPSQRNMNIASNRSQFDCFGPDDSWNYEINEQYRTLFRGHLMSKEKYKMYSYVWEEQKKLDLNGNYQPSHYNHRTHHDHYSYNDFTTALLGPCAKYPSGVDLIAEFRRNINIKKNDQKIYRQHLEFLYGVDKANMFDNPLKYKAHLLSEFNVQCKVGSGVYGQVFKARTKRTNRTVAIKSLQLLLTGQQKDIAHKKNLEEKPFNQNHFCPYMNANGLSLPIVREIVALKQLKNKYITTLYDIVLNDPKQKYIENENDPLKRATVQEYNANNKQSTRWNLHLVMEFVPNELCAMMRNLKIVHIQHYNHQHPQNQLHPDPEKLPKPPSEPKWFSCANIKSVLFDLLCGFQYLSEERYVHRDLKPANILLTDEGHVKIADFGLSRPKYRSDWLTNGCNVVTRYYRAPEILVEQNKRKSNYGLQSDMWSIGCIFAELITGKPLFRANSDMKQLEAIINICGGINPKTWPGIEKITERNPDIRKGEGEYEEKTCSFKWTCDEKKIPRFFDKFREELKLKPRILRQKLIPLISNTWTDENIKLGMDLLDRMLTYSPKQRIKPGQALQHQFFKLSPIAKPPKTLILTSRKAKNVKSHTDQQDQQKQYRARQEMKAKQRKLAQQQQQRKTQQQQQQHAQHAHNNDNRNHHHRYNNNNPNNRYMQNQKNATPHQYSKNRQYNYPPSQDRNINQRRGRSYDNHSNNNNNNNNRNINRNRNNYNNNNNNNNNNNRISNSQPRFGGVMGQNNMTMNNMYIPVVPPPPSMILHGNQDQNNKLKRQNTEPIKNEPQQKKRRCE